MEENQTGSNKKPVIVSIVILIVLAVTLFYFIYRKDEQIPSKDLGGEIENSQTITKSTVPPSANPLLLTTPEATPVEKTNPFKYENPFE